MKKLLFSGFYPSKVALDVLGRYKEMLDGQAEMTILCLPNDEKYWYPLGFKTIHTSQYDFKGIVGIMNKFDFNILANNIPNIYREVDELKTEVIRSVTTEEKGKANHWIYSVKDIDGKYPIFARLSYPLEKESDKTKSEMEKIFFPEIIANYIMGKKVHADAMSNKLPPMEVGAYIETTYGKAHKKWEFPKNWK